jgi:hypothetical protein
MHNGKEKDNKPKDTKEPKGSYPNTKQSGPPMLIAHSLGGKRTKSIDLRGSILPEPQTKNDEKSPRVKTKCGCIIS